MNQVVGVVRLQIFILHVFSSTHSMTRIHQVKRIGECPEYPLFDTRVAQQTSPQFTQVSAWLYSVLGKVR